MNTWTGKFRCTDCGREMEQAGTCNDCLVKEQEVDRKIRRDLAKTAGKGKARRK